MKTVYFVRHGESEVNAGAPHFQGDTTELTERGHEQARVVATRATKLPIEALISSSTKRTIQTATHIAAAIGKEIEASDLFVERQLPKRLVGMRWDDAEAQRIFHRWETSLFDPKLRVEDAENFSDLLDRAGRALAYLESRQESVLLVVCHGFFMRVLLARIVFGETLSPDELMKIVQAFRLANTSLTMMQFQPERGGIISLPPNPWIVRIWNDHAHLG